MTELIQINHTNGNRESLSLDTEKYLSEIRRVLMDKKLMQDVDYFLNGSSRINRSSETEITLDKLLNGEKILYLGSGCVIGEHTTFEEFVRMGNDEKISFFHQNQVTHGITFTSSGMERSFRSMYTLLEPPLMAKETVNTKMESSYAFSEMKRNINLVSSNQASIAFHSPYANAKSEYEYEKSKSVTSSKITEYLLSKFVISQARFEVNPSKVSVNMDFFHEVSATVYSEKEDHQKAADLMMVLERWGLYLPLEFTMGGALYTSDEKQITEFKETKQDKEKFSVAADVAFSGYGGGFSYGGSTEESESGSQKEEFKNLRVSQIGGAPGNIESKVDFADSLKEMSTWEMVDIKKFYPSILLLRNVKIDGKKTTLFKDVLGILNENYYIESVKKIQPYINMLEYTTSVEALVSPF